MNWEEIYESKLISVKDAAAKIESGDKVWFGPCSSAPIQLMDAIAERVDELEDVDLVTGLSLHPYKFFQSPKYIGRLNYHTVFYGPYERAFFKVGNINVNSTRLSGIDRTAKEVYGIDTLLADVSVPDEEGYMYFGPMGVALNGLVAEYAKKIIVQVNQKQPRVSGTYHRIHVSDVHYICEYDHELPIFPQPEVTDVERRIAELLMPQIPDGATLQIGLGGLANAVGFGLEDKRDLSIHTEMFTDSMVHLAKRGAITGKILSGFGLGNQELYEFCGEGSVQFAPVPFVNDPYEIAKNDNFISINSCLMADVTGQIGSETLGFYQYSSTGGQVDYVRGASMSKGGKSFVCLPSVVDAKDGQTNSTITVALPEGEVVTTPRSDAMYIVTEYGIADVYNRPIRQRVESMIAIAHPDFRDQLRKEAIEAGLTRA